MFRWLMGKHQLPQHSPIDAFLRRFRQEHQETASQRGEREHHESVAHLRDHAEASSTQREFWTEHS